MWRHEFLLRASCVLIGCLTGCAPETIAERGRSQAPTGMGPLTATLPGATMDTGAAGGPAERPATRSPNLRNDENLDRADFQSRVAGVSGEIAGAIDDNLGTWFRSAAVGSIGGQVIAADTGAFLDGYVYALAPCVGAACTASQQDPWNWTPLTRGVWQFNESDAKLTLTPETQFAVEVEGYRTIAIAHGPNVAVHQRAISRSANEVMTIYMCPTDGDDNDKDGICDDAERQYGTKLDSKDSDRDALSDTMELYGHAIGEVEGGFYDVRALGADPLHADIFMAVRYTGLSGFDHGALEDVMQAFEGAPRDNPDGKKGIRLNILYDERPITAPGDDLAVHDPIWDEFDRLRTKYFGKRPYAFHHALFVNSYGVPSSGQSRGLGASDLVVSMHGGNFAGARHEQAGTLMHELGHNLGLHHNGYSDEGYIPHYVSVMSYNYQIRGAPRASGPGLDFSRVALAKVDESRVDENAPFLAKDESQKPGLELYVNPWIGVFSGDPRQPAMWQLSGKLAGPMDLDGDGAYKVAAFDLNGNGKLTDRFPETRNDWDSLVFGGGVSAAIGDVSDTYRVRVAVPNTLGPCLPPSQLLAQGPPTANRSVAPTDSSASPGEPPAPAAPANPAGDDPMMGPVEPADSAPVEPEDSTPLDPEDSAPVEPEDSTPVEPEDSEPLEPEDSAPVDPEDSEPLDPEDSEPLDPEDSEPLDPEDSAPVEPEDSEPLEPEDSTPLEPEDDSEVQPEEPAGDDEELDGDPNAPVHDGVDEADEEGQDASGDPLEEEPVDGAELGEAGDDGFGIGDEEQAPEESDEDGF